MFYSPPVFDLKLNYDEEMEDEEQDDVPPWPDIEQIFGGDSEYQSIIAALMQYTGNTLDRIMDYMKDFDSYTTMVDLAGNVDVHESMMSRQWSTEEFQHVLAIHTDQVSPVPWKQSPLWQLSPSQLGYFSAFFSQIRQMNKMPKSKRLGLMQVMSQEFCSSCLPYPKKVVDAVCERLPVIALKRNENLLAIIKVSICF